MSADKETLADRVAKRLRREILSGKHAAGDKLTPELELAERFGVNRFTVREAMNKLEQMHLIARRPGKGTVVLDYTEHAGIDVIQDLIVSADGRVNPFVVANLLEAARALAAETAALAADRRSPSDLERLRAIVASMKGEMRLSRLTALDFDFHWAMAGAAGNIVPRLVLNSVRGVLAAYAPFLETLYVDPDSIALGYEHVVAAITQRDAERARALLRFIWVARHHRFVGFVEEQEKVKAPGAA